MKRLFVLSCMIVILGLSLGACRKSEQGRPLMYKKGTYLGAPDQKISPEALEKARLGAWRQRGF